jgi:hypothetical protein
MVTVILVLVLVVFGADAIYSRARLSLRRRAATQPQRPAFDLVGPSRKINPPIGGLIGQPDWRPLDEERADSSEGGGEDLSRLFGGMGNGRP